MSPKSRGRPPAAARPEAGARHQPARAEGPGQPEAHPGGGPERPVSPPVRSRPRPAATSTACCTPTASTTASTGRSAAPSLSGPHRGVPNAWGRSTARVNWAEIRSPGSSLPARSPVPARTAASSNIGVSHDEAERVRRVPHVKPLLRPPGSQPVTYVDLKNPGDDCPREGWRKMASASWARLRPGTYALMGRVIGFSGRRDATSDSAAVRAAAEHRRQIDEFRGHDESLG